MTRTLEAAGKCWQCMRGWVDVGERSTSCPYCGAFEITSTVVTR